MLHILNGDSTRLSLEPAGVPGTITVWADVLYEGPVPPLDLSPERQREIRARFIGSAGWASYEDALRIGARWDAAIECFREHDEVVIWCEHDLFDQLLLIRHLAWFAVRDRGDTALSLICIGEYPGMPHFMGLGQLDAGQLAALLPTRVRITSRQLELGRRAFAAFTHADPRALERLVAEEDTSSLPFLGPALSRLLREYPSTRNGLSRTEQELLAILATRESMTAGALWRAMHQRDSVYYLTDLTFRALLTAFASAPALLTRTAAASGGEWDETIAITPLGRALLAGEEDLPRLRGGIDRWLGGVHLRGAEPEWRWDEASARLVRSDATQESETTRVGGAE